MVTFCCTGQFKPLGLNSLGFERMKGDLIKTKNNPYRIRLGRCWGKFSSCRNVQSWGCWLKKKGSPIQERGKKTYICPEDNEHANSAKAAHEVRIEP